MKRTFILLSACFAVFLNLVSCANPESFPGIETDEGFMNPGNVADTNTMVAETEVITEAETADEYGILEKDRIYVSVSNIEDGRKPITYDDVKDKYDFHMYDASELFRDDYSKEGFEKVKKENTEGIQVNFPWMLLDLDYVCSYVSADHPELSYDVFANEHGIRCEVLADGTLKEYDDVISNNRVGDLTAEIPYEEYARTFLEHWYGEGYLDEYEATVDTTNGIVVTFRKQLHGYATPDFFLLFMYHEGSVCHYERAAPGYTEIYKNVTIEQLDAAKEALLEHISDPSEPVLVLANDGYLYMKIADFGSSTYYFYYTRIEP